ncbi:hypothetical protein BH11PAT1_BH11PAT1_2250 [soil metagenome]
MSALKQQGTETYSKGDLALPRSLGIVLVILGGVTAVAAGVYVTHSGDPIWALILIIFLVERVRDTTIEYRWKPTLLGGVMAFLSVLIGVAVLYLKSPTPLWGLILIGLLTDAVI